MAEEELPVGGDYQVTVPDLKFFRAVELKFPISEASAAKKRIPLALVETCPGKFVVPDESVALGSLDPVGAAS